jgi:hypothetical protein
VHRIGDGQAHVRYSMAGRSGGRVTPCTVCTMHKEMRSAGFLVWPQNQGRGVSRFGLKKWQLRFGDLSLKITATFSSFRPQNQADDDLSVAPQKPMGGGWVVHVPSPRGSHEDEAEDGRINAMGCIRLFYPYFTIFVVLDPRGILIFWMGL